MTESTHAFRKLLCRAQRHLLAVRLFRVGCVAGGIAGVVAGCFAASGFLGRIDIALAAAASATLATLAAGLFFRPSFAYVARLGDHQAAHDKNLSTTALERINAPTPAAMDELVISRALAQLSSDAPHPPRLQPFATAMIAATWLAACALGLWTAPPADQAGRTMAQLDAMTLARRATLAAKLDDAIDRATIGRDEQLRRNLRALAKSVEVRDVAAYRKLLDQLKERGLVLREVLPEALQVAGMDTSATKPATPATPIAAVNPTASKDGNSIRIYTPPTNTTVATDTDPAEGTFDFDEAWNRARREALQPTSDANRSPHDQAVLDRYFQK